MRAQTSVLLPKKENLCTKVLLFAIFFFKFFSTLRHYITLHSYLVIHYVARLKIVRMRQAVGLPVMVVALSICWNDAINIMRVP